MTVKHLLEIEYMYLVLFHSSHLKPGLLGWKIAVEGGTDDGVNELFCFEFMRYLLLLLREGVKLNSI